MTRNQRLQNVAKLIESNKKELLEQFKDVDIMEWYAKEYKGRKL